MIPSHEQDAALARIKAETLIESLPWLQAFHGKVVVIKFGGNAMIDDDLQLAFAEDLAYLRWVGIRPVVVHGGGPQISARLSELGIKSEFKNGLRVTSAEAIPVIRDVLKNQISAKLAALINQAGAETIILNGEDGNLLRAEKLTRDAEGNPEDFGFVGDVVLVNPRIVHESLDAGQIPVISTVAPDADGQLLNVNADSAAAAIAVALGAEKFMVLTDVPGLYAEWPNRDSLISEINTTELAELIPSLDSGMIPKMQACQMAVVNGVPNAHVVDGRTPHSILLEIFTKNGIGTIVSKSEA
jgi:acetylglutamate kinase